MDDAEIPMDLYSSLRELEVDDLLAKERLLQIRDTRIKFATEHHVNTRGEKMDFRHYPHIRAMYDSLAAEIVAQGSVQSFKSEWAIIDQFAAAYNGLSVFVVVPKYEMRNTYVQNRINRCVENVPEYKKIIGNGFFDSIALKSFGKGVIKYVGSNVIADFKEFPADMILVDEVDECHQENVDYALDRTRASRFQFKRYIGNPRHRGKGINAYFLRSDQREWYVPCMKCGEFSQLDWFESVVEAIVDKEDNIMDFRLRDTKWEPGCRRDIHIMCPKCDGGVLERASMQGEWRPQNPGSLIEGYHISMLCSPINSVTGMWDRFSRAINDPARLQHFYNSDLGLPFTAVGNRVTETLLDNCADKEYEFKIEMDRGHVSADRHDGPCSMGVDVGGVFDVRISYVEPRGARRAVFIGKVRNIEELHDLIERYNVEKVVIDSLPEVTLVQDFQETARCDVWMCRYRGEGSDRRRSFDLNDRSINVDRTEILDRAFGQLRQRKTILPANFRNVLAGEYVKEMCGPIREIVEDERGNSRYEWSKCKDHQRHADAYDLIASSLLMESVLDDVYMG